MVATNEKVKFRVLFSKAIFVLFALVALPYQGQAAVPNRPLQGKGVQVGGLAGTGFTLLNVSKNILGSTERIIFDIGEYNGQDHKGWPAYYHVELKDQPSRQIVIDLAQTPNSRVDESVLKKVFKNSKYIGRSQIVSDPTEPNMTVILDLKKSAEVKVYQVEGKKTTSKIVIDVISK